MTRYQTATRHCVGFCTSEQQLAAILKEQRAAFAAEPFPNVRLRRLRLAALERLLLVHRDAFAAAIDADFGRRSTEETCLLEIFPTLQALRFARRRVARWVHPERREVSAWFSPGSAEVRYQPLGVIGIVAPWNYPLYLTFGPLVDALAAGNRAMIKPSEHSPRFARLLAQVIAECFPRDLVHVVEGDLDIAKAFSALPFDHLVFTGSTAVGRAVMAAAARTLTPITLELGGKSPAIVGPAFDLRIAARRILFGKLVNAGQTCVAPDYVLAPVDAIPPLLAYMREAAGSWYGTTAGEYTSIAQESHYTRLLELLEDARSFGAQVEPLLQQESMSGPRCLAPVVVLGPDERMRLMREEIFGPILPIIPYHALDEAITFVNSHERPLALYLFENDRSRRKHVLARTASGGVTLNDTLLHAAQASLPFGGCGASGMGRYHGFEGFKALSQTRAVFQQRRWNSVALMQPPHGKTARILLRAMLRL